MTKVIKRVFRGGGGSPNNDARACRAANRNRADPNIRSIVLGFRPAFRLKRIKR